MRPRRQETQHSPSAAPAIQEARPVIMKVFPVLAFSTFCSVLGMGVLVPLLPSYAQTLGASGLGIGLIFAGFSISRAVVAPFAGYLSDRKGRKAFVCGGLLASAFLSVAYQWANDITTLMLLRLVHGAAVGGVFPIAQACVGDLAPRGKEGAWMGYYTTSYVTAFGVGPLLGGVVADHFGLNVAFVSMGSLNLLAFLTTLFLLPEVKNRQTVSGARPSFARMGQSAMVRGLFSYRVANEVGWGTLFTFLPIITAVTHGFSSTMTGILFTSNIVLTSTLLAPMGRLADRFNRRALVVAGGVLAALQLGLTGVLAGFGQLLLLSVIGGLGAAVASPALSALSVEEGRKFGMGTTLTTMSTAMSIGGAVGPIVGGAVADASGIAAAFYLASGIGLAGTIVFFRLSR